MQLKKKIAAAACVVAASAFLTGCNKQIFDFQYTFDTAIVTVNGETKVYPISSWTDYAEGEQLQLILQDGSVILVSSYNTILSSWTDYAEGEQLQLILQDGSVILVSYYIGLYK